MSLDRRQLLAMIASVAGPPGANAQTARVRLLLNTSFSGPVSFFLLAEDRGFLRDAGIELALSQGGGAAVVVPQVELSRYDAGYGDMCALIERIARGPENQGPVAVYTTFNATPFTIAVAADGPIRSPKDFEARTIIGHSTDAALLTFDLLAAAAGIDAARVRVRPSLAGMGSQVAEMLSGADVHGVFGFVNTIIASIAPLGIDPRRLRFVNYADHLPEMYGNTLFVTRDFYTREKPRLAPLVRAINSGLAAAVADPATAIDALQKRQPSANRDVNLRRFVGTLRSEMAHPEGGRIGIGDMDDTRLARLIERIVTVKRLPRRPATSEVFDRAFLPPDAERICSLAAR